MVLQLVFELFGPSLFLLYQHLTNGTNRTHHCFRHLLFTLPAQLISLKDKIHAIEKWIHLPSHLLPTILIWIICFPINCSFEWNISFGELLELKIYTYKLTCTQADATMSLIVTWCIFNHFAKVILLLDSI